MDVATAMKNTVPIITSNGIRVFLRRGKGKLQLSDPNCAYLNFGVS